VGGKFLHGWKGWEGKVVENQGGKLGTKIAYIKI